MSLKDNDFHETGTSIRTLFGGNGDYYIQIWFKNEQGLNDYKSVRVCMSGGFAPTDVRLAVAKLHKTLEENDLNEQPR